MTGRRGNSAATPHLACGWCGERYPYAEPAGLCSCGRPLLVRLSIPDLSNRDWRRELAERPRDMWRYRELLPPVARPVTLGEGYTSLMGCPNGTPPSAVGPQVLFKWEGDNPTGSFKARGMAMAVSRARELGIERFVVPTAGNAGVAAAAYVERAGGRLDVFMPADTSDSFVDAAASHGAQVHRVDGYITDCGRRARDMVRDGAFDLSTLKEPYRLEGKKTMGLELWEQLDGSLPDVIIYPTGGGTGLIGMWKAFAELEAAGLIGEERPRMISVQMAGCAPMSVAFGTGARTADPWPSPATDVLGLRVPAAVGDFLILEAVRASGGSVVTVEEAAAFEGVQALFELLGLRTAPECGAAYAACLQLMDSKRIDPSERVVVFLTGAASLYSEILNRHGVNFAD